MARKLHKIIEKLDEIIQDLTKLFSMGFHFAKRGQRPPKVIYSKPEKELDKLRKEKKATEDEIRQMMGGKEATQVYVRQSKKNRLETVKNALQRLEAALAFTPDPSEKKKLEREIARKEVDAQATEDFLRENPETGAWGRILANKRQRQKEIEAEIAKWEQVEKEVNKIDLTKFRPEGRPN